MASCKKWSPAVAATVAALLVCTTAGTAVDTESWNGHASSAEAPVGARLWCMHGNEGAESLSTGTSAVVRVVDATPTEHRDSSSDWKLKAFKPIRIVVSTLDLDRGTRHCTEVGQERQIFTEGNYICTEEDVLTSKKKDILRNKVLKDAVALHRERLSVRHVTGKIVVSEMNGGGCNGFEVPLSHRKAGVHGADFVFYVAAMAMPGNAAAWATSCQFFPDGRSAVGASLFSPKYIAFSPFNVRLAAHEILHALGFTTESFENAKIFSTKSLRGKPLESPGLNSPKVLAAARAQYGCPTLDFAELEDEGGVGRAGTHWERRNSKDDLMCSLIGVGYYTAMTLAAMEDLGHYKANYAKAEVMPWGRNAGCKLFEEKCVKGGVSQNPSMFCTDPEPRGICTSDRRAMGSCGIWKYSDTLPSALQYFSDPSVASFPWSLMDGCPAVEQFYNGGCFDGNITYMPGSVLGKDARCFDTPTAEVSANPTPLNQPLAICAEVKCSKCRYSVRVKGSMKYVQCKAGTTLSLPELSMAFKAGSFTCPPFNEVCTDHVNPSAKQDPFAQSCDA